MATEHWFRWHHGVVTDPKWKVVASRTSSALSRKVTVGHVVSVWAAMMENASQANPRGELLNWSDEDIGAALDIPEEEVAAIRVAMQGKTLDEAVLMAWKRRQVKAEDHTAADRKRAQRERDKSHEVTAKMIESRHVTRGHDRVEESREEKKDQEQMPPPAAAGQLQVNGREPAEAHATTPPAKRGTRLPVDWTPTGDELAWARKERSDLDVPREALAFRDYWIAKPGREGLKLDWVATFRNWIRNAKGAGWNGRMAPNEHTRPRQELSR